MAINAHVERENAAADLQRNLAAYQVWRLAHFMRIKRLPRKPDDLTPKLAAGRGTGPDWRMQKAAIEMINAAYGGFDNRRKAGPKED